MFSPEKVSFQSLSKRIVYVSVPIFRRSMSLKVEETTTFLQLKNMIIEGLERSGFNSADSYVFRVVFADRPGCMRHLYHPVLNENVLEILRREIAHSSGGGLYLTFVDVSYDIPGRSIPTKRGDSAVPTIGRSATEWAYVPPSMTPVTPDSNVLFTTNNAVFIPVHAITGSTCNVYAGMGLSMTSVEIDFINEVHHRSMKCGKVLKLIPGKDTWREFYCMLDENRLWFHTADYDVNDIDLLSSNMEAGSTSTGVLGNDSIANSGGHILLNGGCAAGITNHCGRSYIGYIDLDCQTDALLTSTMKKPDTSSSFIGRFFGSEAGRNASQTTNRLTRQSSAAIVSSSGNHSLPFATANCGFSITYNNNLSSLQMKAYNDDHAMSWIYAISNRHSLLRDRTLLYHYYCPVKTSFSIVRDVAEGHVDAVESQRLQEHLLASERQLVFENNEILKAESFIASNEMDLICGFDMNILTSLSTFTGMISNAAMRGAFHNFLSSCEEEAERLMNTTTRSGKSASKRNSITRNSDVEQLKKYTNYYRFWCFVEDYTKSYPDSPEDLDEREKNMLWNCVICIYDAFVATTAPQSIVTVKDVGNVALKVTDAQRTSLHIAMFDYSVPGVRKSSFPITSSPRPAVPPVDIFSDVQKTVLNILLNVVYKDFITHPNYVKKVLHPAVYHYIRAPKSSNVMLSKAEWMPAWCQYFVDVEAVDQSSNTVQSVHASPAKRGALSSMLAGKSMRSFSTSSPNSPLKENKVSSLRLQSLNRKGLPHMSLNAISESMFMSNSISANNMLQTLVSYDDTKALANVQSPALLIVSSLRRKLVFVNKAPDHVIVSQGGGMFASALSALENGELISEKYYGGYAPWRWGYTQEIYPSEQKLIVKLPSSRINYGYMPDDWFEFIDLGNLQSQIQSLGKENIGDCELSLRNSFMYDVMLTPLKNMLIKASYFDLIEKNLILNGIRTDSVHFKSENMIKNSFALHKNRMFSSKTFVRSVSYQYLNLWNPQKVLESACLKELNPTAKFAHMLLTHANSYLHFVPYKKCIAYDRSQLSVYDKAPARSYFDMEITIEKQVINELIASHENSVECELLLSMLSAGSVDVRFRRSSNAVLAKSRSIIARLFKPLIEIRDIHGNIIKTNIGTKKSKKLKTSETLLTPSLDLSQFIDLKAADKDIIHQATQDPAVESVRDRGSSSHEATVDVLSEDEADLANVRNKDEGNIVKVRNDSADSEDEITSAILKERSNDADAVLSRKLSETKGSLTVENLKLTCNMDTVTVIEQIDSSIIKEVHEWCIASGEENSDIEFQNTERAKMFNPLIYNSITEMFNYNTYCTQMFYHALPGPVLLMSPARCRYNSNSLRYFGSYHCGCAAPDQSISPNQSARRYTMLGMQSNFARTSTISNVNQFSMIPTTPCADTQCGAWFNGADVWNRCVLVLVEVLGEGVIYIYDSWGLTLVAKVHLSQLTKIAPTESVLHSLDFSDTYGLGWQLLFCGIDDEDCHTICNKWLSMLSCYAVSEINTGNVLGTKHLEASLPKSPLNTTMSLCVVLILQEGYISKKGVYNTAYQKRWFVLTSDAKLMYYKSDTFQLKGVILLSDIVEVSSSAIPDAAPPAITSPSAAKNTSGGGFFSGFSMKRSSVSVASSQHLTNESVDLDSLEKSSISKGDEEIRKFEESRDKFANFPILRRGYRRLSMFQYSDSTNVVKLVKDKNFYVKTKERVYHFQADSVGDAAGWVIALKKLL